MIEISEFVKIPISKDSGRFVSALMQKLLTSDEMRSMSLMGGICVANKGRNIEHKQPIPENIKTAVVGKT